MSQVTNSPQTCADDATNGSVAWANPDNAKVSDDVLATTGFGSGTGTGTSHYLKATNFGFSIPSGATINGILVEVEKQLSYICKDSEVKIIKADGTIGTTNKADTITNWPSFGNTYVSYGGSSDLWGETWDDTKINDVDFGVAISALITKERDGSYAYVDHIRITVYYTEVAAASTGNMFLVM